MRSRAGGSRVTFADWVHRSAIACLVLSRAGDGGAALAAATAAIAVLEPLGDCRELARAYKAAAGLHLVQGSYEECLRLGGLGLELAEQEGDEETSVHLLITMGSARVTAGDPAGVGRAAIEAAVELMRPVSRTH